MSMHADGQFKFMVESGKRKVKLEWTWNKTIPASATIHKIDSFFNICLIGE